MKQSEQEKDVQLLGSGDPAEDLPDWASKIEALAHFLSALAYHEGRGGRGTTAFEIYGEQYGSIIADYARAINRTASEHHCALVDVKTSILVPMERIQSVNDFLKNTSRPEDLIAVDHHLQEMNDLIETVAMPLMKIFEDLKASRQRILTRKAAAQNG